MRKKNVRLQIHEIHSTSDLDVVTALSWKTNQKIGILLCARQLLFDGMSDEKFGCALPPKRKGMPEKEIGT